MASPPSPTPFIRPARSRPTTGCPKRPSWAITAAQVIDDPKSSKVRFEGGRLQLFGINLPLLPVFNIARGNEGTTGWLVPDFSHLEPQRVRARRALSLADGAQPRR